MLFGLYAMDGVQPFDVVALHGMVRDKHGKKMSKSFGNAVDPLDWMDAYGSDALRFTLARGANPGVDVPIGEEWVQGSRNFCNKLWNAARFALLNGATTAEPLPPAEELSTVDRWLLSRLAAVTASVDADYEHFEFAKASESLYHFVWDDFCDWYVELAKVPLAAGGAAAHRTRLVLGHALDTVLRLLHPVVPFVTEALWTALTGGESLVVASWPQADGSRLDPAAEAEVAALQDVVTEVRRFRSEQGLRPSQRVAARIGGLAATGIAAHEPLVRALTRLDTPEDGFAPTASLSVRTTTVELDLSGAIDVAAERARLTKDLAAAEKELRTATAKLANTDFIDKAPDAVVAKVRTRLASAESDVERITGQLGALPTP
jgi:valyl-tRNA synthetase